MILTRCEWPATADGIFGVPPALNRKGRDDVVASLAIAMCLWIGLFSLERLCAICELPKSFAFFS